MEPNKTTKKEQLSKEELERLEILQRADEVKGEQLSLNWNSELISVNEAQELISHPIDDPVQKFQLYYKGLHKLLRDFLPKGKRNEEARRLIYDEKNVLINRGARKDENGIRGSDGRMAYIEDLELALKIVANWVTNKGSYYDLYRAFWEKNEELKYGHQE